MDTREFCKARGITATAEQVDHNPNMDGSENMDHWRVTLKRGARRLTVTCSMGYGHNGAEPTAGEVLDCLASDAAGVENARDFADWCADYGYSDDSRKAERTYTACKREVRKLRVFLGAGPFDELLWNTERL